MSDNKPWFENERFWDATQPFIFDDRIMKQTPVEVDGMLTLLEIEPNARILDLCCGPGRHSLELARRGYAVTGVDRKSQYLDSAKEKARGENLNVEFVLADMRRFRRANSFDAVINYFTSFGYFDNSADEKQVLDNIYESLEPGGSLLLDLIGKEVITRIFQPRDWREMDGKFLLDEREPLEDWTYMVNRRMLIDGDKKEKFEFTIRLYSAVELKTLLKSAGFTRVDIFGDINGSLYDHKAKRLVAVARK